jgi:hypothetical protein
VTGGSRGIGKMIAAGFLAQREPGAEKVVELNFHVAVGAMAEHEDSRLRIVALRNPALSLALRNKFENQLFVGSPIDCFGCKTLSIQSNIGYLSLAPAPEKSAKPVRALFLLIIVYRSKNCDIFAAGNERRRLRDQPPARCSVFAEAYDHHRDRWRDRLCECRD